MPSKFNLEQRVRLTPEATTYYGGLPGKWVPANQGGVDGVGTITATSRVEMLQPGAYSRPYMVAWDTGLSNSYREDDLEAVE